MTEPAYTVPPEWIDHILAMVNSVVYHPDGFILPFDEEIEPEGPKAMHKATGTLMLNVSLYSLYFQR